MDRAGPFLLPFSSCLAAWPGFSFCSERCGNVLVLYGVTQCTEGAEFSWEVIANLPLCSLSIPCQVLLIGAGDRGVLQEGVKHSSVELACGPVGD